MMIMHHYRTNINDYIGQTFCLSLLEHGIFLLLRNRYYQTEKPLPADAALLADVIGAKKAHEKQALATVLRKMFVLNDGVYMHEGIEKEIATYKLHVGHSKVGGRLSGLSRCNTTQNVNPPSHSLEANHKPITIKEKNNKKEKSDAPQPSDDGRPPVGGFIIDLSDGVGVAEPPPRSLASKAPQVPCPDGVSSEVWSDFVAHRKRKRADITATALRGITSEAAKAGFSLEDALALCVTRGWIGFKAEWLLDAPLASKFERGTAKNAGSVAPLSIFRPEPSVLPKTPQVNGQLTPSDCPDGLTTNTWGKFLRMRQELRQPTTQKTIETLTRKAVECGQDKFAHFSLRHTATVPVW